MRNMIDLHCHILPYVDDGAVELEESLELLKMEAEQGVRQICLTPHYRKNSFETPDETVLRQFRRLQAAAEQAEIPVELFLSREYFCDSDFLDSLPHRKLLTMGQGNVILAEMSSRYSIQTIANAVRRILEAGYRPLIAHVERYPAVRQDLMDLKRLKKMGALIQVNAGSLLGKEGFHAKRFSRQLMKAELIDVVASDSHSVELRSPNLEACSQLLTKKMGWVYARKVLRGTQLQILYPEKGE